MVQSTTNGKILELVDFEHDIAQALAKSPPPQRSPSNRFCVCDHSCPVDGGYDFIITLQDKGF
jgi:hypothetical protein